MPSQIPCGSAIETAHVHYGSFLLFLSQILQGFDVGSTISISRSCFSLLSVLSTSKNTLLEESHHYCADKFRWLVVYYMDKRFFSLP